MAALIHLCGGILQRVGVTAAIDEIVYFSATFGEQFDRHLEEVAHHGGEIIPDHGIVMTYSASGSVGQACVNAFKAGKKFKVLISEARPINEGIEMARRLIDTGIPTTLMTDAALANAVATAQLVLVGCDAILPNTVVNKTGTYALALLAKLAHVPVVCLGTSEKILSETHLDSFKIIPHPAREISPELPQALKVENVYFDQTPLPLFHTILLETGPMTMDLTETRPA
ncbi:MAG: hypothetical protein HY465_00360 [Deltaproteobacteria bacterium]|nr:hypothetical protein [Deltaproteobacteria bacterium]